MLDDKPNFNDASVLAFPLTTVAGFNAFVVAGDVVNGKLDPSVPGFAIEKPKEMPPLEDTGLKVRSPKTLVSELLLTFISVSFTPLPLLCLGLPHAMHLSSVDLLEIQHSLHVHGLDSTIFS